VNVYFLVGSESGNAEMVADCVSDALRDLGHEVERFAGGGLAETQLADKKVLLVCTSTTGIGDLPQNVRTLYDELSTQRPSLRGMRYGLIGLGDRNYKESFLGAPKKWDQILTELGAERLGERLELDATDNPMPDEDAVRWVKSWAPTHLS
jgi:MioC protein